MIALYLRVSQSDRDKCDDEVASASIDGQRLQLMEHVERLVDRGEIAAWEADGLREFVDDGFSGMNTERPGLKGLVRACEQGEIDCVIVNDFSRLARSYIDLGDLIDKLFPENGVRFISKAEGIDLPRFKVRMSLLQKNCIDARMQSFTLSENMNDDLMRGVVALCNNSYSMQISQNVKSSMHASWRHGDHVQAFAPYGYLYDKQARGHLKVDPVAAKYVRRAFTLAASGFTAAEVARKLESERVPTPAAYARKAKSAKANCYGERLTPWNARKVRYLVRREVYTGTLVAGETCSLGVGRGSGKRITEDYERIRIENAHEPLVSMEVFEKANEALDAARRGRKKRG